MPDPLTVREMRLRLRRMHAEMEEIVANIDRLRRAERLLKGMREEHFARLAERETPRSPFTHSTSRVPTGDGKWEKAYKRLFSTIVWLADARRRVLSAEEMLARFDSADEHLEPLRREQHRKRRRRRRA